MTVSADTLRLQLDYTFWASRRLLDVAAQLTPEELAHDFRTANATLLDTLVHVFAGDRVWFARVQGTPRPTFVDAEDRDFTKLQAEWPELQERWKEWAATLTDQEALQQITYTDLKGNPWQQPLWQILLHVVNHGTHHRGQVSGFLRAMGRTPPPLDLIAFYRSR